MTSTVRSNFGLRSLSLTTRPTDTKSRYVKNDSDSSSFIDCSSLWEIEQKQCERVYRKELNDYETILSANKSGKATPNQSDGNDFDLIFLTNLLVLLGRYEMAPKSTPGFVRRASKRLTIQLEKRELTMKELPSPFVRKRYLPNQLTRMRSWQPDKSTTSTVAVKKSLELRQTCVEIQKSNSGLENANSTTEKKMADFVPNSKLNITLNKALPSTVDAVETGSKTKSVEPIKEQIETAKPFEITNGFDSNNNIHTANAEQMDKTYDLHVNTATNEKSQEKVNGRPSPILYTSNSRPILVSTKISSGTAVTKSVEPVNKVPNTVTNPLSPEININGSIPSLSGRSETDKNDVTRVSKIESPVKENDIQKEIRKEDITNVNGIYRNKSLQISSSKQTISPQDGASNTTDVVRRESLVEKLRMKFTDMAKNNVFTGSSSYKPAIADKNERFSSKLIPTESTKSTPMKNLSISAPNKEIDTLPKKGAVDLGIEFSGIKSLVKRWQDFQNKFIPDTNSGVTLNTYKLQQKNNVTNGKTTAVTAEDTEQTNVNTKLQPNQVEGPQQEFLIATHKVSDDSCLQTTISSPTKTHKARLFRLASVKEIASNFQNGSIVADNKMTSPTSPVLSGSSVASGATSPLSSTPSTDQKLPDTLQATSFRSTVIPRAAPRLSTHKYQGNAAVQNARLSPAVTENSKLLGNTILIDQEIRQVQQANKQLRDSSVANTATTIAKDTSSETEIEPRIFAHASIDGPVPLPRLRRGAAFRMSKSRSVAEFEPSREPKAFNNQSFELTNKSNSHRGVVVDISNNVYDKTGTASTRDEVDALISTYKSNDKSEMLMTRKPLENENFRPIGEEYSDNKSSNLHDIKPGIALGIKGDINSNSLTRNRSTALISMRPQSLDLGVDSSKYSRSSISSSRSSISSVSSSLNNSCYNERSSILSNDSGFGSYGYSTTVNTSGKPISDDMGVNTVNFPISSSTISSSTNDVTYSSSTTVHLSSPSSLEPESSLDECRDERAMYRTASFRRKISIRCNGNLIRAQSLADAHTEAKGNYNVDGTGISTASIRINNSLDYTSIKQHSK